MAAILIAYALQLGNTLFADTVGSSAAIVRRKCVEDNNPAGHTWRQHYNMGFRVVKVSIQTTQPWPPKKIKRK